MHADLKIIIGRKTPFHNGHAYIISNALKTSKHVLILLGSCFQSRTIKNPFTYEERVEMIVDWLKDNHSLAYQQGRIHFLPLIDYANNQTWIQQVQAAVDSTVNKLGNMLPQNPRVVLSGSDRDSTTWYLHVFPAWGLDLIHPIGVLDF